MVGGGGARRGGTTGGRGDLCRRCQVGRASVREGEGQGAWLHCLSDTGLLRPPLPFDGTHTQQFTSLPLGSVHRHTSHAPAPAPAPRARTRRGGGGGWGGGVDWGGVRRKDTEHFPLRSSPPGGVGGGVWKCQSRRFDLLRRRHTEQSGLAEDRQKKKPTKQNKNKQKNRI